MTTAQFHKLQQCVTLCQRKTKAIGAKLSAAIGDDFTAEQILALPEHTVYERALTDQRAVEQTLVEQGLDMLGISAADRATLISTRGAGGAVDILMRWGG